jgi:hypothetical protein
MHYFHNREESAEILRRALRMMAPHKAAFHPVSYAVWYEHAAYLNPGLSRDLDKITAAATVLTETDVARLYAMHIAARDVEAFERAQGQLRCLLEDTATEAAGAQTAAVDFTCRGRSRYFSVEPERRGAIGRGRRYRADAAMYRAKDAGRNRVSLAAQRAPAAATAHSGTQAG